ncbi:RNA-binding protein [Pseudopelagicola sp. nBUS_19]|uniref:RNA-binding protein n=1 Tax=Pseudopelagicola sp. nBUS_19 TaxID=3395316 RepID=UPI003EB8B7D3
MGRGSRSKDRDGEPDRKCIVTGEVASCTGMVRFVIGPQLHVVPDILGKLPGRGMWVSAERSALVKASEKGLFSRSARAKVSVPLELVNEVERQLARRVVDLISLARKSGHAIAGFEKVKDWIAKDQMRILLQASDGSERGKSKLWPSDGSKYIDWLTSDELGLAFGRQTVIHGALASGGLALRVVEEAQRLKGVRGITGAAALGKEKTAR